jgi:uncharacterized protein DUF5681
MSTRKGNRQEAVGYRRPPKKSQFKQGKSGNPKGRPIGSKNVDKMIAAELEDRVHVTENGRRRKISKLEGIIKQIVNKSLSGDPRATQTLLGKFLDRLDTEVQETTLEALDKAESNLVMAEIVRRFRLQEEPISELNEANKTNGKRRRKAASN